MSESSYESPQYPLRWRGPLPDRGAREGAVRWLVTLNILAFVLVDWVHPLVGNAIFRQYGLSLESLELGWIWTLVTHMFLHGGLLHLGANMIALYSFGRVVENVAGVRRLLMVYFLGGIAGGLLQVFLTPTTLLVGASGGVFAVIVVFCWMNWSEYVRLLLVFVIPLNVKGRALMMGLLGGSLLLGLWAQFAPESAGVVGMIGHWAHLGGGLVGLVFGGVWFRERVMTREMIIRERLMNQRRLAQHDDLT